MLRPRFGIGEVAAGQRAPSRSRAAASAGRTAEVLSSAASASLREVVILPPKTESSGALPCVRVEFQDIVARGFLGLRRAVVVERADAGIGPAHHVAGDGRWKYSLTAASR